MAAVIVFTSGDETTVHISPCTPTEAAKKIAQYFENFSTDEEKTRIEKGWEEDLQTQTVVMECNDEEHDLAVVLDFTPEAVAWALTQATTTTEPDTHLQAAGV